MTEVLSEEEVQRLRQGLHGHVNKTPDPLMCDTVVNSGNNYFNRCWWHVDGLLLPFYFWKVLETFWTLLITFDDFLIAFERFLIIACLWKMWFGFRLFRVASRSRVHLLIISRWQLDRRRFPLKLFKKLLRLFCCLSVMNIIFFGVKCLAHISLVDCSFVSLLWFA